MSVTNRLKKLELKQKKVRNECLNKINETLLSAKTQNNGRLLHRIALDLVKSSKASFPWITRDVVNGSFRRRIQNKQINSNNLVNDDRTEVANVLVHMDSPTSIPNRRKGGRPKNTAAKIKRFKSLATTAFRDEVASKHASEKDESPLEERTVR